MEIGDILDTYNMIQEVLGEKQKRSSVVTGGKPVYDGLNDKKYIDFLYGSNPYKWNGGGYRLVIDKTTPLKVPLSYSVDVSPEFRKQFEQWSGRLFGYESNDVIVDRINGVIYASPSVYELLKSEICIDEHRTL